MSLRGSAKTGKMPKREFKAKTGNLGKREFNTNLKTQNGKFAQKGI